MYQKPIDDKTKERFWSKVDKRGPDECWEWVAYKYPSGYGSFWFNGRNIGAHRFSLYLKTGIFSKNKLTCHKCDNPSCVNPDHLFLGTHSDNSQDMRSKGRYKRITNSLDCAYRRGSDHYLSKLSEDDIRKIRKIYKKGKRGRGVPTIAKMYGVRPYVIYLIVNNITWKHV